MEQFKTCSKCNIAMPRTCFSKCAANRDGLKAQCKACIAAYYAANRDRISAQHAAYQLANAERISIRNATRYAANKEPALLRASRYYAKNKEVVNEKRRNNPAIKARNRYQYLRAQQQNIERSLRWQKRNPEKHLTIRTRANLSRAMGVPSNALPSKLIEAKLAQLQVKRLIKEKSK